MTEYSCEVWIAHKYTFYVQAESIDDATEKAKRIASERQDEGEEVARCSVRRKPNGRE